MSQQDRYSIANLRTVRRLIAQEFDRFNRLGRESGRHEPSIRGSPRNAERGRINSSVRGRIVQPAIRYVNPPFHPQGINDSVAREGATSRVAHHYQNRRGGRGGRGRGNQV